YNTARAQELALWAETQPGGERIHDRLFQAYQVDNVDVNDVEVLLGIVEELGWDVGEARVVLDARTFAQKRQAHWTLAQRSGVTAVPTFVVGQRGVVGAQPTAVLKQLINAPTI
ncbi:MAG: DsbA family protein, partial [Myxococcota bacterium]